LIDYFYGLDAGELGHAIILMMGILYLLLEEYHRLFDFFFLAKSSLSSLNLRNRLLKIIIRFSVVCIPLLLIMAYGSRDKNPQLTGKYRVKSLIQNQESVEPVSCQDSVLTIIYFDQGNDIVFEYNSQVRKMLGSYDFNKGSRELKARWRFPLNKNDTLFATLSQVDKQNQLTLIGKMGKDSLRTVLLKVK